MTPDAASRPGRGHRLGRDAGGGRRSLPSRCSRAPLCSPGTSRIRNSLPGHDPSPPSTSPPSSRWLERAAGAARGSERRGDRMDGLAAARLGRLRYTWLQRDPPRTTASCIDAGIPTVGAAPRLSARAPIRSQRSDGPVDELLIWGGRRSEWVAATPHSSRTEPPTTLCRGHGGLARCPDRRPGGVLRVDRSGVHRVGSTARTARRLDGAAYNPVDRYAGDRSPRVH